MHYVETLLSSPTELAALLILGYILPSNTRERDCIDRQAINLKQVSMSDGLEISIVRMQGILDYIASPLLREV